MPTAMPDWMNRCAIAIGRNERPPKIPISTVRLGRRATMSAARLLALSGVHQPCNFGTISSICWNSCFIGFDSEMEMPTIHRHRFHESFRIRLGEQLVKFPILAGTLLVIVLATPLDFGGHSFPSDLAIARIQTIK